VGSRVRGATVVTGVVASLAGTFGLTGCADDEPSGSAPETSAESPEPATEQDEPTSPDESSASSPEPASGREVDAEVMTYRLPEGRWELGSGGLTAIRAGADGGCWLIVGTVGDAYADTTLDELGGLTLELEPDHDPPLRRADNRTVDGVEGYVVEGTSRAGTYYEWGAVVGDTWVQLEFDFPEDSDRALEWREGVLASIEWK
jgi:hypothetical protein